MIGPDEVPKVAVDIGEDSDPSVGFIGRPANNFYTRTFEVIKVLLEVVGFQK